MMTKEPGRKICGLCDLRAGEQATVASIDHELPIGRRLMAMGLMPGSRLRLLGRAPLGDPLMVELPGSVVCLRGGDARCVGVYQ